METNKTDKSVLDWLLEGIAFLCVVFMWGLTAYQYNTLPEQIPIHFNASGMPDAYKEKQWIWLLPAIGSLLFALFWWVNRFPHRFNYPIQPTKENAANIFRIGASMIRVLNLATALLFFYLNWASIQVALGNTSGLGSVFIFVFLGAIFSVVVFFLIKLYQQR